MTFITATKRFIKRAARWMQRKLPLRLVSITRCHSTIVSLVRGLRIMIPAAPRVWPVQPLVELACRVSGNSAATAFPAARFVHIHRDGPEAALSMRFPDDYRYFLLHGSDVVYGTLEPALVTPDEEPITVPDFQ